MKNFTIFVGVLLAALIGVSYADLSKEDKTCASKLGISEEQLLMAYKTGDFKDKKFRCLSQCLMTEFGELNGDNVEYNVIQEIALTVNRNLTEAKVKKLHTKCLKKAKAKKDKCDYATSYDKCFWTELKIKK